MTVRVGDQATVRRVVTQEVVTEFCEITKDFDPLHVDEEFARTTVYGRRIAPGGLVIGWMLGAAAETTGHHDAAVPSIGFDRIRHVAPVFVGDTVQITYTVTEIEGPRGHAEVIATGPGGETVGVADHVFKILE
jgi:3-hydroxybutyryl-CoA dehydratase